MSKTEVIRVRTPEERRASARFTARVNEYSAEINDRLGLPAPVHYTTRPASVSHLCARFSTRHGSLHCVVAACGIDNHLVAPVLTSRFAMSRDEVNAVLVEIIDGLNDARLAVPFNFEPPAEPRVEPTDDESAECVALGRAMIRLDQLPRALADGEIRVTTCRGEIIVEMATGRVVAQTPGDGLDYSQRDRLKRSLPALRRVAELIATIYARKDA